MRKVKYSYRSLTSTQQAEFEGIARNRGTSAGYQWLEPQDLPTAIPEDLRRKLPSALLMWERSESGCTFLVCNGVRLDSKAMALDQEPFGVAVYSSGASTGGVFLHHGEWDNRTVPLTPEVKHVLSSSSLPNYFPLGEVPPKSSGPLSDLRLTSHHGAFKATLQGLLRPSA